ncbi:MAG: DNA polymerase III subunit delta [Brevinema sp.]
MLNIIILGGENPVLLREDLEDISSSFDGDKTTRFGEDINPEEFFTDIATGSLFASKRMFIVRGAQGASSAFEKSLLSYLNDPLDSVCLILEYEGKVPAKIESQGRALGSTIAKVVVHKRPYPEDQKRYVNARLAKIGIKAPPSVAELIVQLSGGDIEECAAMVGKLIDYLGTRKSITEEDIAHVLERVHNASVFDLVDAIFMRNTTKALSCFRDLASAGESLPGINAMMLRAARNMWAVKCSQNGLMPQGLACSPYEWKKYQGFSRNINLRFVSKMTEVVSQIEIASKTLPEMHSTTIMENFLLQLENSV